MLRTVVILSILNFFVSGCATSPDTRILQNKPTNPINEVAPIHSARHNHPPQKSFYSLLRVNGTKTSLTSIQVDHQTLWAVRIVTKFTLQPSVNTWQVPNLESVNVVFPAPMASILQQKATTLRILLSRANPPTYELTYLSNYLSSKMSDSELKILRHYSTDISYSFQT